MREKKRAGRIDRYFPFFKSKLAVRLSLYVFMSAFGTVIVLSSVQAMWEYREAKIAVEKELDQIVKTNVPAIEENLWILNIDMLRTMLEGLLQRRNFVYFKLSDEKGKTLVEVGKFPERHFIRKRIPLYFHDLRGRKVYIGSLTMVATTEYIRRDILHNILMSFSVLLATMLLVAAFMLYLVWTLISKHLLKIKEHTRKIRFDKEMTPLKLDRKENRWTRDDVLASLTDTINKMQKLVQSSYAKLEYQSLHDPLTDLPNRRALRMDLSKRIEECARSGRYAALFFIDLDSFKTLNDSLGHTVGDGVLKVVAKRLEGLRDYGVTIYRVGGDEFLIVTDPLSADRKEAEKKAHQLANEIRRMLDKNILVDDKTLKITASIGIEIFHGEEDIETIIKHADNALYRAKEWGQNNIAFFTEQMQKRTDKRLEIEQLLYRAIKNEEFITYFQPKIDKTRKIRSAETLTRLPKRGGGLVPPGDFIPLAEETGLIIEIDHQIIRKTFRFVRKNYDKMRAWGMENLAINISAAQFMMADFVQFIVSESERYGIDSSFIVLELTEEAVVSNVDHALATMMKLKAHGFHFSIDDFGTGYSSMRYLVNFPLDELKIDKSFIDHILDNDRSAAVVRSIIALARSLQLKVVAEGVETEAQLEAIYRLGDVLVQGYLFSPPLPEEEFLKLLKKTNARA